MPIPKKEEKEKTQDFLSRCMGDSKMNKEYPDKSQRYAVCSRSINATAMDSIDYSHYDDTYGNTEEIDENNFYLPEDEEYITFSSCDCGDKEEDEEEYDVAQSKPGLWENIRKKKERMGDKYKPAKPGDKDRPDPNSFKKAQAEEKTKTKVKLNNPFRTPSGPKKFSVYVKNEKGNVVKVNFGDPNMSIKRDDPQSRKNFRARHNCDNAGPKWKAKYWSCKFWSSKNVSDLV